MGKGRHHYSFEALPLITVKDAFAGHTCRVLGKEISGADEINLTVYSFEFLKPDNRLRHVCVNIMSSFVFSTFILLVIMANSITMALEDPRSSNDIIDKLDIVFLSIFIVEMVIKMIALGLVSHRGAYLRSAWNLLDLTVVVTGIVTLAGTGNSSLNVLRFFRVMRPLRTISRVKSLKVIVCTLVNSVQMLVDVFLLLLFLMVVLAIFGMHMWSDAFYQRCYLEVPVVQNGTPIIQYVKVANDSMTCAMSDTRGRQCYENAVTAYNQSCLMDTVPNRALFTFDHFGFAMMLMFKVVSLDDWPDVAKDVMGAMGQSSFIFFFVATFVGGYVCMNLFIAVLCAQFSLELHALEEKHENLISVVPGSLLGASMLYGPMACCLDIVKPQVITIETQMRLDKHHYAKSFVAGAGLAADASEMFSDNEMDTTQQTMNTPSSADRLVGKDLHVADIDPNEDRDEEVYSDDGGDAPYPDIDAPQEPVPVSGLAAGQIESNRSNRRVTMPTVPLDPSTPLTRFGSMNSMS
eukprot:PhF_6_TR1978/c0_g1_i2/m.3291